MIYNWLDGWSVRRKADRTYEIERRIEKRLISSRKRFPLPVVNSVEENTEAPLHIAALYKLLGFNPSTDSIIADQMPSNLGVQGEPIGDIDLYRPLLNLDGNNGMEELSKRNSIKNPQEYIEERYGELPGDFNTLSFRQSGEKLFRNNPSAFVGVMSEILSPFFYLDKNNQVKYLRELEGVNRMDRPSILVVAVAAGELEVLYKAYERAAREIE